MSDSASVVIYKNRTKVLPLSVGIDVSADTITSEVRETASVDAELLATWTVTYLTDGVDGELILTMDDSITSTLTADSGYMDVKRVSGGEPLQVFDKPLHVDIRDAVTA